jgi:hypothetical protein
MLGENLLFNNFTDIPGILLQSLLVRTLHIPETFGLLYLFYPGSSPDCVAAVAYSSYISMKTAASYKIACYVFLDAITIYLIFYGI